MSDQLVLAPFRALDANGLPVASAQAFFYQSGTTTPLTTFADEAMETAHPSPLVANGSGVFPAVFTSGSSAVKIDVRTPAGASLPGYPIDPALRVSGSGSGAADLSFAPITGNANTNVQAAIAANTTRLNGLGTPSDAGKAILTATDAAAQRQAMGVAYPTQALAEAGEVNDRAMTPLRVKQAIDFQVPLTKQFISEEQTISSGGVLTLPHGLGEVPALAQARIRCTVNDPPFGAGAIIVIAATLADLERDRGILMRLTNENVWITFGNDAQVFEVLDPTTGESTGLTNSSWTLSVRAWA